MSILSGYLFRSFLVMLRLQAQVRFLRKKLIKKILRPYVLTFWWYQLILTLLVLPKVRILDFSVKAGPSPPTALLSCPCA